ncbi:MAG: hypothetical protein P4L99_17515 [Chthoniobacter sp.]|nr:hypothetical protein [Chthoniobacter sp.]
MTIPPPTPSGPSPHFRYLLPALLFAAFGTLVFWWNPFGPQPEHAYFEALIRPSVPGQTQLVTNIDGTGLRKELMMSQPVKAGMVNHVRFTLRAGKLCAFILTPLNTEGHGDGTVDLLRCWMTTEKGELVAILRPSSIADARTGAMPLGEDGAIRLPARVGEINTGLDFKPEPPIDLALTQPPPVWQFLVVFVLTLTVALVLPRLAQRIDWRARLVPVARWVRRQPRTALFLAAVASVAVSCFPVVFCGKSFVSPDNGLQLLYEQFPTVPGALGGRVENPAGTDVGATYYWHLPASVVQHRAIFEDGEFPLWDRYNRCGVPLWAQCMSMLGDPLHWPAVISGGAAWAWDGKFLAAKVLFALGIGLLVRVSSRSLASALLLTLSAPFIGFFCFRFCHPGFFAISYAPWILLPWLEAVHAPTRRRVAGWAALLIFTNWWQLNSGTAKESCAFLLCLNAGGALALLGAPLPGRERLARLGLFAWANVLFVLLSAPLWLVFIEALGKASTAYDQIRVCQIQPSLFIGLFDDIFYRQLMPTEFIINPSANFFVLLGTAWALVRARALAADRSFLAALIGAAGAAAITFGVVSPLFLAQIPLFKNIYHVDDTFSGVLFIFLFVLAGYGIRECRHRMRLPEWRGDWIMVLCLVGVLLAAFLGMTQAAHRLGTTFLAIGQVLPKSEFMWGYGTVLVISLAVWPWAWRAVRLRQPAAAIWFLVGCAAWTALHFRHGMYLVTNFDLYTMNPKTRLDLREIPSPAIRQIQQAMREPARVSGIDWVMTGINALPRFEAIDGADALQSPALHELTAAFGLREVWAWRNLVLRQEFAKVHRGLDLLGVRYYLDKPGRGGELPGLRLLGTSDLDVLESETAWPRGFFTDSVLTYHEPSEIARLLQDGDGRPFAAVLPAERARLPLPPADFNQRSIVSAHNYRLTQNTTTFEIDTTSPGVAVLGESWVPRDIQVVVDGRSAEALRVNHAFRGVLIEKAGHHVVTFRYWPAVLGTALWLALVGAVGFLATAWVFVRRTPESQLTEARPPVPSPVGQV